MYLEKVEIRGFRGLKQLSIGFQQITALIGENAWGKTSLLRALWCLLGQDEVPYQFVANDFHRPQDEPPGTEPHLEIILTFREYRPDMCKHSQRLARLERVWVKHRDRFHRIHYRAAADLLDGEGELVISQHGFMDELGHIMELENCEHYIHLLMLMNPVLRLRDARAARGGPKLLGNGWEANLTHLADTLLASPGSAPKENVEAGLDAVRNLMGHYLTSVPPIKPRPRSQREIVTRPASLRGLSGFNELVRCGDVQTIQLAMASIGAAMLAARGDREIEEGARPILMLEDPESRLHPTMLALVWGLLEQVPGQKILTTNSGDLLSALPLNQIRRLVRHPDRTRAYQLNDAQLSGDDLRRIAFHVRINRPMSLFARSWLLVEGETEIWLLSELANICGFSLRGEGVRIIEFAQCGHVPLIKVARDLGIEWHLLADGDPAGVKYVEGARSQLRGEREQDRLTLLPAQDIEHFLFENGFEEVFRKEAGVGPHQQLSPSRIIDKAVNRRSKPGMALAVVEAAEHLGPDSIPRLLRQMFSRVVAMSCSQC